MSSLVASSGYFVVPPSGAAIPSHFIVDRQGAANMASTSSSQFLALSPSGVGAAPFSVGVDAFDAFVQAANPQHPEHLAWREKYGGGSTRSLRKSFDDAETVVTTAPHRRHRTTSRPSSTRSQKPRQSFDVASLRTSSAMADGTLKPATRHGSVDEQRAQSPLKKKSSSKDKTAAAPADGDTEKRRRRSGSSSSKKKRDKGKSREAAPPVPPPRTTSHAAFADAAQNYSLAQSFDASMSTSSLSQAHSVGSSYGVQSRGMVSPYHPAQSSFLDSPYGATGGGYLPHRGSPMHPSHSSASLQPARSRASMSAVRQHVPGTQSPMSTRRSIDFRLPDEDLAKLRQEMSSPQPRRGLDSFMSPLRQVVSASSRRSADKHLPVSSHVVEPMPILRSSLDLRAASASPIVSHSRTSSQALQGFGSIEEAAELAEGDAQESSAVAQEVPSFSNRRQRVLSQPDAGRLAAKANLSRVVTALPKESMPVKSLQQSPSLVRADAAEPAKVVAGVRRKSRRRSVENNAGAQSGARHAVASSFVSPLLENKAPDGTPLQQDSSASDDGLRRNGAIQSPVTKTSSEPRDKMAEVPVTEVATPASPVTPITPVSPAPSTPTRTRTKVHRKAVPSHLLSDLEGLNASDSMGSLRQGDISTPGQERQQHIESPFDSPSSSGFIKPAIYSYVPDAPTPLIESNKQTPIALGETVKATAQPPQAVSQALEALENGNAARPPVAQVQSESQSGRKSMDFASQLEHILEQTANEKPSGGMFSRFRRNRASSRVSMSKSRASTVPSTQQAGEGSWLNERADGVMTSQSADASLSATKSVGLGIETPGEHIASQASSEHRVQSSDSKWRRRLSSFSSNKSLRLLAQAQAQKAPPMPANSAVTAAHADDLPQTPVKAKTAGRDESSAEAFVPPNGTIHKSLSPAIVRNSPAPHESDNMFGSNDTELIAHDASIATPLSQRAFSAGTPALEEAGQHSSPTPASGKKSRSRATSLHSSRRSSANEMERARSAQDVQTPLVPVPSYNIESGRKSSFDIRRPRLRSKSVSRTSPPHLQHEHTRDRLEVRPRSSFAADRDRSPVLHQLGYPDGVVPAMPSRASTAMRRLFGQKSQPDLPRTPEVQSANASRASLSLSRMASNVFGGSEIAIANSAHKPVVQITSSDAPEMQSPIEPAPSSSVGCDLTPSLTERTDPDTSTLADSTSVGHRKPSTVAESFIMMNSAESSSLDLPHMGDSDMTESACKAGALSSDRSTTADLTPPGTRSANMGDATGGGDLDAFGKMLRASAQQDAARVRRIAARTAAAAAATRAETSSPCIVTPSHS